MRFLRRGILCSGVALTVLAQGATAHAAEPALEAAAEQATLADSGDTIIVTGTRDANRTARDSLSPIAIVTGEQLKASGQTNLREALARISPSISLPGFTSDIAGMVDTFRLRGLGADQTLVLVNGVRRHSTATINNNVGPDQGSTGADINMIPLAAIDHVEILQDGASALYGSDAIGGVVNIILKSGKGGEFSTQNGASYHGDGFTSTTTLDYGFGLGAGGFIHLSGEYTHQSRTDRGIDDQRTGVHDNLIFGRPRSDRQTLGFNAGYDLSDKVSAYAFGTYGHRSAASIQNYRLTTRLPAIYPNGYSPVEHVNENDFSITAGLRGVIGDGWNWDLSSTYGEDRTRIDLRNSANLSLHADTGETPTSFHIGNYYNTQWTNALGVRRALDVPFLASPLNIAFGGEHRRESYGIGAGDEASYYGVGSDAYGGVSAINEVSPSRNVVAGYVNADASLFKGFHLDLAGRWEHYSDAGSTATGKASARYDVARGIALRGTASTGFRAPTLAQEYYTNIAVGPDTVSGQLAVNSPSARLLGAEPLKAERSTNFSGGLVLSPSSALDITVDAYQIKIRNRIVEGGVYSGQTAIDALAAQGVTLPTDLTPDAISVQYFSNGADTRSRGIDIAAHYRTPLADGKLAVDLALNFNRTKVTKVRDDLNGNPLLNAQGIAYLSSYSPRSKIILGATYQTGPLTISAQETRYGHTTSQLTYFDGPNAFSTSVFRKFRNAPRFETNLSVSYDVNDRLTFTVGGNNIFDAYPSRIPVENSYTGVQQYDGAASGIGTFGGYYYARIGLKL